MNFLTKYKIKTRYIKIDLVMRDISNICSTVDSAYVVPKRQLAIARSSLYGNLKKSLKETKKAKGLFVTESRIAYEYNRYIDIIEETKDERLQNMNSRYLKAINEGDYKTAELIVRNMSTSKDIVEPPPRLTVITQKTDPYQVILVATNEFDTNLLITNFNILSDTTTQSDVYGTMLIQGKERKHIALSSETGIQYPLKIAINYSVNDEDRKLTYSVHMK